MRRRAWGGALCWHGAGSAGGGRCCWCGAHACAEQYLPLARRLRRRHAAVWLLDVPGFGVTPALADPGVDACIDFMARFLEQLKQHENNALEVVGHSFGAFLLQAALARHPAARPAVHRLVLVSVGSLYPQLHARWWEAWRTLWWACFFKFRVLGGLARWAALWFPVLFEKAMARWLDLRVWIHSRAGESMLSQCLRVGWSTSAWTRPCHRTVGAVGVPVALVWGDPDPLFPCAQARRAAAEHGLPLLCVPGGGHQPLLDTPQGEKMGGHLIALALLRARRPAGRVHMIDT